MILRINLVQNYSSKFGNSQQQFTVTDGGCKQYTSNTAKFYEKWLRRKQSLPPLFWVWEGGRREERRGGRRRGGKCNSCYERTKPQSWTPCLLISALYSVCWREGKRRERREERRKKRKRKNKSKSKSKRKSKRKRKRKRREKQQGKEKRKEREQERESVPSFTTQHNHRQPTVILRVSSSREK